MYEREVCKVMFEEQLQEVVRLCLAGYSVAQALKMVRISGVE